ncbi:hypothetical protein [Paenibacillus sp.]|uniref:hypothetical protein n=1 Tax=Paenibacillus sp. TaxID=58172 RepID=UPI0028AF3594|nr:hypothetical protein [Paenibacillus sp.]
MIGVKTSLYFQHYCRESFESKVDTVAKAELGQNRRVEEEFAVMNYEQETKGQLSFNFPLGNDTRNKALNEGTLAQLWN